MTPREDPAKRCRHIRNSLIHDGIFRDPGGGGGKNAWLISPDPFWISEAEAQYLQRLGPALYAFYRASNRLYEESVRGRQPAWVHQYLDQGKPEGLIEFGRMSRFKGALPRVIRPDILRADHGMVASELDAVPGGIGLTQGLNQVYEEMGFRVLGGRDGMVHGFGAMLAASTALETPICAIVVSDESKDYRPEMNFLADALRKNGMEVHLLEPRDVGFQEEGLYFEQDAKRYPIHSLYRFFELFDLKNIPKAELIQYAAKKRKVEVTPPFKAYLEEKLLFALFHHPVLEDFWKRDLGPENHQILWGLFPKTWVLDPRELPPYGVIPGLSAGGRPVTSWNDLSSWTQKERQHVIKPSGFSELAWGSRGVSFGQDISSEAWLDAVGQALAGFGKTPSILQVFHKGKKEEVTYDTPETGTLNTMSGRVRLCPYYFVVGNEADPSIQLGGVLATVCPMDKKAIHGMEDAVLAPVAVRDYQ